MRTLRFVFAPAAAAKRLAAHEARLVARLPLVRRVTHPRVLRHGAAGGLGLALMFAGSTMATHADEVLRVVHVPHVAWDALAYFLHGLGAIPFVHHVEPLYRMLAAAE